MSSVDEVTFCCVSECFVTVYTKSFSGFFCTINRHRRWRILANVYASFKKIDHRFEVRTFLYLVNELHLFKDYSSVRVEIHAVLKPFFSEMFWKVYFVVTVQKRLQQQQCKSASKLSLKGIITFLFQNICNFTHPISPQKTSIAIQN